MKMTNKEYRVHEGVSRSQLATLLSKTPLHFKWEQEHPKEDTPALAFGRASHKYILEGDDFEKEFAVAPECDRRTKEGKEAWANFQSKAGEREIVSAADFAVIKDMAAAVNADPVARKWLTGTVETSYFWVDEDTGELCKVRPDCIATIDGKKYIVDYKTTDSCADRQFEYSVRKYLYKLQAGMYVEGLFANEFEDYGFAFVAQEKTAPYACRVYVCTEGFITEGFDMFRKAIGLYHYCKTTGNWYGYEGMDGGETFLTEEGE